MAYITCRLRVDRSVLRTTTRCVYTLYFHYYIIYQYIYIYKDTHMSRRVTYVSVELRLHGDKGPPPAIVVRE